MTRQNLSPPRKCEVSPPSCELNPCCVFLRTNDETSCDPTFIRGSLRIRAATTAVDPVFSASEKKTLSLAGRCQGLNHGLAPYILPARGVPLERSRFVAIFPDSTSAHSPCCPPPTGGTVSQHVRRLMRSAPADAPCEALKQMRYARALSLDRRDTREAVAQPLTTASKPLNCDAALRLPRRP
jgi:hypothetical protein